MSGLEALRRRAKAAAQVFVTDPGLPILDDADSAHLLRVLRLHPGEAVIAADGQGHWSCCEVAAGAPPESMLEVQGAVEFEEQTSVPLTVCFAPTKGERPEWVVQKLTELGIDRIIPIRTDHSVVHWEGAREAHALARLERIARAAAAQSRRVWLPEIGPACALADLAASDQEPAMAELDGEPPSLAHPVVAIGPEGGWSQGERDLRWPRIGLGPMVLRAETAALAAGSILSALRAGTVRE
jgi:16S rRNA (uracil1498-N3)-methyltransferase